MKRLEQPSIIFATDGYKPSHYPLYPRDMTGMYAYIESRGGKFDSTLQFGTQFGLNKYLTNPVTYGDIAEGEEFFPLYGAPFDKAGWLKVYNQYGGHLPFTINAVPEGTLVPTHVPLVSVSCEDPDLKHLATYVETWLLRNTWYGNGPATTSFMCKRIIKKYLELTADNLDNLPFKLHDFGGRGGSGQDTVMLGGGGHIANFLGSDTIEAIWMVNKIYHSKMSAFTIPALEHSITTAWGRDGEVECMRNALEVYGGQGKMLAAVSDTYDIFNAVENVWGTELKEEVVKSGTMLVIRPDSGDPVFVVSRVMRILGEKFGFTVNSKGYKLLNNVRVIQGDGVNLHSIEAILKSLMNDGFSADNIAFGMGGALLQQIDRDTQRFAMKASAKQVNGEWIGISKDPITDPGKASKAGRVTAIRDENGVISSGFVGDPRDIMQTVYKNGEILVDDTIDNIRARANSYL